MRLLYLNKTRHMNKPFIHPDILLTVMQNISSNQGDKLDSLRIKEAQKKGREFANQILSQLFKRIEYGKIESHFNTERLNSTNFKDIREHIITLHSQRDVLSKEVKKHSENHSELQEKLIKAQNSIFKFLFKKKIKRLTEEVKQSKIELDSIKDIERESYLNITYEFDKNELREKYSDLISAFTTLKGSIKIWDMTYSERNLETKAAAQTSMLRNQVSFSFDSIQVIQTLEKSFRFENFNGGDFYFYPSFIVYFKSKEDIAILDYNDLLLEYSESRFLEEEKDIPHDTQIIGETWYRVNKDGSPDRRFVNNYKIPIVLYGSLHFKTDSGINELYYISDAKKAKHFYEQYTLYQVILRQPR